MSHRTRRRQARPHPVGEQALLAAAVHRGPVTAAALAAERSHVTGRDDREISFRDLPPENPHLLSARPQHTALSPVPQAWLCTVPLVDPVAELCDDVELHIARFACAVSDLVVRPNGKCLLAKFVADRSGRPVSEVDRRPLGRAVGYELETAVSA